MKKHIMLLSVAGCALFFASCTATSNEKTTANAPKVVPVSNLVQLDTVVYKEYIADIQSQRNVELRSRLVGFLDRIFVDEGAYVRKGQVLFSLVADEYKADLAQAQASVSSAEAEVKKVELEMERTHKLVQKNIVSSTEYDLLKVQLRAAKAKVAEAEAVLNQARTKLSNTQIRAPFDGRIDRIQLKEGSLLEEGSLLTTISDMANMNVYFDISEQEYLGIASDSTFNRNNFKKEVQLILANGATYPNKGIAEIVESEFEASTGSISLRAKFNNPQGLLKHGATGRIGVPVQTGDLLLVHQKSVFEIQDKAYVYTLKGDTVKMTPFENGRRVGHYYVVENGLPADAKVVYEGVQSLRDGMVIQPRMVKN
ncbi:MULTISPECIES: efflux RND transporter periplasmic adaptor subunit [Sphingobacterium]|uniref:Hemolysin D n=1 Tax=Sphingobacterium cellulitidis TaxID=1768011 RepID=A0A8H9KY06_9SPHI|nr:MULTISPECIES: efflux RND transporter periplasmic adaptor subunit [Sphingobacterium]MBA8987869.1 membrane fusion protein (multidrug efflux system) [Sphingobacterium soli]OYD46241.1 efflux transporter periplasmic adaptor subunit [Sphingobacterium cellulitidis]WFB64535.1 efflux RND transporter periplasmic adaptor subunit [Sphingobacterium sp. WM]GGE23628.1 hemolysin D [Sphingobacterium soli]